MSVPDVSPKVYRDPKATQPILWFSLFFLKRVQCEFFHRNGSLFAYNVELITPHKTFVLVLSLTKETDLNSEIANCPLCHVAGYHFQYNTPNKNLFLFSLK